MGRGCWFWGLRLHLVTTLHSLPVAFALTRPGADERQALLAEQVIESVNATFKGQLDLWPTTTDPPRNQASRNSPKPRWAGGGPGVCISNRGQLLYYMTIAIRLIPCERTPAC
jgi:hypothetical protein